MAVLPFEVTPKDVRARIDAGEPIFLIDVRRPDEYQITRIEGAEFIPMDTAPQQLGRLEGLADQGTLIVFCHHGMRSASVVNWLRGQGVEVCQSMSGGIDQWSMDVDPAVPRY